jgi:cyclophilin family peptidyl-prolyl cis-trans isomerase
MARVRDERIKARKAKAFRRRILAIAVIVVVVVALVLLYQSSRPPATSNLTKVILRTSKGDITIELFDDMPITTNNFKDLVSRGIYGGTIFHRIATNPAVIQGGGTNTTVATILDELPNKHSNVRGSVAMAKTSQPNSATSQFYINVQDNLYLDSNYSVFGQVIDGMDVVDEISSVPTSGETPLETILIFKAEFAEP